MKITNRDDFERILPTKVINRKIHSEFIESMDREEVSILYGARQVGKSVEVWQTIKELFDRGPSEVFYYNFDEIPSDANNPDVFLNSILSQMTTKKCFVFIDEAQRKTDVGKWIKYMYDQKKGIKWVLTGSASLELKNKTKESLVGRKIEFYLSSLDLMEILGDMNIDVKNITGRFEKLDQIVEEYLRFGGYPGVYQQVSAINKIEKLTEVAETYLISDLANMYGIQNKDSLRLVASFVGENVGSVLSKDNIAKVTALKKNEVEKVLEALEGGFVVRKIKTFSTDSTKELIHRPKVFFEDLGIRNALLRKLEEGRLMTEKGKLWENLVVNLAANKWGWRNIRYWRTINQTEVDVVVVKDNGRLEVIEAKYSTIEYIPKNVASFSEKYRDLVDNVTIVSRDNWWGMLS
ncbi:ATP-binding protein [Candidatus Shapirobacteria bacterium]|nr:ATP-binding protein [Candidatus Shapirobacteria bacterium]